jgi:hypothetical protein
LLSNGSACTAYAEAQKAMQKAIRDKVFGTPKELFAVVHEKHADFSAWVGLALFTTRSFIHLQLTTAGMYPM